MDHTSALNKCEENDSDTYLPASRGFIPRYTGPQQQRDDEWTEEQRSIRDEILRSRPRTGLNGPFGPWLAVPSIARPASELGRVCRYGTSLHPHESELVILLVAAKMRSSTEFDIHVPEALRAGITLLLIKAIPRSGSQESDDELDITRTPTTTHNNVPFTRTTIRERVLITLQQEQQEEKSEKDESQEFQTVGDKQQYYDRLRAIILFTSELLIDCTVSDGTYHETKVTFNQKESVLVEIISIIGYYTYVAYTLNVFNIPS